MLVPKLRFPEFTDEYKDYEFKDAFEFLTNNSYARNDLNYNNGIYNNLHYGDILIKIDNILDCNKFLLPYINDNIKIKNEVILKENDIIFADTAEDYTAGKCCEIININSRKVLAGLHTIPCRKKITVGKKYLGFYLNSYKFHKQLLPLITGTKVYGISKSTIVDTTITLPNNKIEEEKIADFLSLLDKKIELQSKKIEVLKMYSESTKNIVFKSFKKNNSTIYSLKDLLKEVNNKAKINNQYSIISSTTKGIFLQSDYFNKQAASSNTIGYKIIEKNQLVLSPQNLWMGNININDKYDIGIVSPSYKIFDVNHNIDLNILDAWIKSRKALYDYNLSSEQGASVVRKNLNLDLFYEISLYLPKIQEQKKYGNLLINLKNKIKLEEKKLNEMIQLKKGLMQNMFV